jgi:hypothetical protein
MIIILERDKITQKIKDKLLKKGLSLIGRSDKEIIFIKLKRHLPRYQIIKTFFHFVGDLIRLIRIPTRYYALR